MQSEPGKTLNLTATAAPNAAAAAEYYPGMYWYSMLKIPAASEFPGTGDKGNGMPDTMKIAARLDRYRQEFVPVLPRARLQGRAHDSEDLQEGLQGFADAWARRTQAGQAMANMALTLGRLGPEKAYHMFADWTDRIAAGELPFAKPERPQGHRAQRRHHEWDWATPKIYLHDAISTDKRNPTVNANGLIYGSPEESTDLVPMLDPVKNKACDRSSIPISIRRRRPRSICRKATSAYWGDEPIWDGHTSIHNPMMDEKGRVWFTARIRPAGKSELLQAGLGSSIGEGDADQGGAARSSRCMIPKTGKWSLINTCFTTHHLYFGHDANNTLWTSAGGRRSASSAGSTRRCMTRPATSRSRKAGRR